MLIDLHVQSNYSRQGVLEPEEIILRAKTIGLDGLCFTEDQPITDWDSLAKLAKVHEFAIFAGRSLVTEVGHLLFYPTDVAHVTKPNAFPSNKDSSTPLSFEEVAARSKELGGVLAAAHPYKLKIDHPMGDKIFQLEGLNALEVRNGQCKSLVNDFALEASFHLKLAGIAGSNTCTDLNALGTAASLFVSEIATQKELVDALQAGNLWPATLTDDVKFRPKPSTGGRDDRRGGPPRGGRGGPRGGRGGDRRDRR